MKKSWIRLNVNYFSKNRENAALETSIPIKTMAQGLEEYTKAIMLEKCADVPTIPARVSLDKYTWNNETGKTEVTSIVNNELYVSFLFFANA